MDYSSKIGCLIYYDSVLCKQNLCEPTMLFLLGLEAVLTKQEDYLMQIQKIDELTGNPVVDPDTKEPVMETVPNEYRLNTLCFSRSDIPDLFDDIFRYLYYVPDQDPVTVDNIEYDCYGMKIYMNNATGTDTDRVVPFIFHEDYDAVVLGLPEDADLNTKAHKLIDVMRSAGYDKSDSAIRLLSTYKVTDSELLKFISEYNEQLKSEHFNSKKNGMIYKLLDYKAMYSYALGVLYGCKCLGFDDSIIWRTEPSYWYDGDYSNLVSTAYEVFQLHYTHPIKKIDIDPRLLCKYKGIQQNKLWNFDNSNFNIKADEILCNTLYIENGNEISFPIMYSKSTGRNLTPPGSYLLPGTTEWHLLDSSVIDSTTGKGIASDNSTFIRYIANDEVYIDKAYSYSSNKYLSPNENEIYFIHTGNLGWASYSEDSYKYNSSDNPTLTLVPVGFDSISSDLIKLARNKEDNSVIMYYQCYVTSEADKESRKSLYGILPDDVTVDGGLFTVSDDTHFSSIVSDLLFSEQYEYPINPEGYTLTSYYNLSSQISIYVYNEDSSMMWNGGLEPIPVVEYGYTKTPSAAIDAYIDSQNDTPDLLDLRYNGDVEYGYWSSMWSPKEWKSIEDIDKNIFITDDIVNLYKNESVIASVQTYSSIDFSDSNKYLFNNYSISELANLPHGFIPISQSDDSVYSSGITTYPCQIIYEDEFGNSLLDDFGNPLVWQDPNTNQYWNGVFNENKWQDECPSKFSKYIYDSSINEMKLVNVKESEHIIYINGSSLTYDELYDIYPNSGIINTTVKVFNDSISETDIFDCYVDTYRDKYCVPTRTDWLSRSEISALGYRFVNGIASLFMGNTEIDVVYDSDHLDVPAHLEE